MIHDLGSLNCGTNGPMEPATGRDVAESRLPRRSWFDVVVMLAPSVSAALNVANRFRGSCCPRWKEFVDKIEVDRCCVGQVGQVRRWDWLDSRCVPWWEGGGTDSVP